MNERAPSFLSPNTTEISSIRMLAAGDKFPSIFLQSTAGPISFPSVYNGKWVLIFNYISDYSPVCTTEMMAFTALCDNFNALNTEILAIGTDTIASHIAWVRDMERYRWGEFRQMKIGFPLASVTNKSQVECFNFKNRITYIVDCTGEPVVLAAFCYPEMVGRSASELLRVVQSLRQAQHGCATPADWQPEQDLLAIPPDTAATSHSLLDKAESHNLDCLDWYICFQKYNDSDKKNNI